MDVRSLMYDTSSGVIEWVLKLSSILEDVFFMLVSPFFMSGVQARYNFMIMSAICVNR